MYSIFGPDFFHLPIDFCNFLEIDFWPNFVVVLLDKFGGFCQPRLHLVLKDLAIFIKELFRFIFSDVFLVLVLIVNNNNFRDVVGLEKIDLIQSLECRWDGGKLHYCRLICFVVNVDLKAKSRVNFKSGWIDLDLYSRNIFAVGWVEICIELLCDVLRKTYDHLVLGLEDTGHYLDAKISKVWKVYKLVRQLFCSHLNDWFKT